ncbi:MAG: AI-2E family transporter, partial [Janthinobacterium lividum]
MPATPMNSKAGTVPVRTILATIGLVLATAVALLLLYKVQLVLVWIVVALFFTVALYPVTGWVERKIARGHRTLATILVFLVLVLVVAGLVTAFAVPLATEGASFATQLPQLITDARAGQGPVGRLLERTHALAWVQSHQAQIAGYASGLTGSASGVLSGVASGIAGVVTVFVLSILMVLEGPKVVSGVLNLIEDEDSRERVRAVTADCAKSITGYISGNLLISIICGALTYLTLKIMGVPFAGL